MKKPIKIFTGAWLEKRDNEQLKTVAKLNGRSLAGEARVRMLWNLWARRDAPGDMGESTFKK